MPDVQMPVAEFIELLEDEGTEDVATSSWRHGTVQTVKVVYQGESYLASYHLHSSEGIQEYGTVTLRPAKQVEITTKKWVIRVG